MCKIIKNNGDDVSCNNNDNTYAIIKSKKENEMVIVVKHLISFHFNRYSANCE